MSFFTSVPALPGAHEALAGMRKLMQRLKLTVNEDKTRLCRVPQEHFDFLGYPFGRCYSPKTGRVYIGSKPSKKSVKRSPPYGATFTSNQRPSSCHRTPEPLHGAT